MEMWHLISSENSTYEDLDEISTAFQMIRSKISDAADRGDHEFDELSKIPANSLGKMTTIKNECFRLFRKR